MKCKHGHTSTLVGYWNFVVVLPIWFLFSSFSWLQLPSNYFRTDLEYGKCLNLGFISHLHCVFKCSLIRYIYTRFQYLIVFEQSCDDNQGCVSLLSSIFLRVLLNGHGLFLFSPDFLICCEMIKNPTDRFRSYLSVRRSQSFTPSVTALVRKRLYESGACVLNMEPCKHIQICKSVCYLFWFEYL